MMLCVFYECHLVKSGNTSPQPPEFLKYFSLSSKLNLSSSYKALAVLWLTCCFSGWNTGPSKGLIVIFPGHCTQGSTASQKPPEWFTASHALRKGKETGGISLINLNLVYPKCYFLII